MTNDHINQLICPQCTSGSKTICLSQPERGDGTISETWYCGACDVLYRVGYEAVAKELYSDDEDD